MKEGPGNAVAKGAGLAGDAAAVDASNNIKLIKGIGKVQWLANYNLEGIKAEVIVYVAVVNGYFARAGVEAYTRYGFFTPACAVKERICFIHGDTPLKFPSNGLLGSVLVLITFEDAAAG